MLYQNFICQRQFFFSFKFLFKLSKFQWHFSFTWCGFLHCAHMTSIFLLSIVQLTFCGVSGSNNFFVVVYISNIFFMANCYFLVLQNSIFLHPRGRIKRYGNNLVKQNQQPFICLMLKAICDFQNSFVMYLNLFINFLLDGTQCHVDLFIKLNLSTTFCRTQLPIHQRHNSRDLQ